MTDQLETALTRTLSEAAESAPSRPPSLLDEVEGRFRTRRRRRYAAVAGVAAFAVIGGSALAAGVLTGKGAPPGPSVVAVPAAAPGKQPPVADTWPEAYHKLSAKLADGRRYQPQVLINDRELLITTDASFENANELWIIDLEDRKARRIVRLPEPAEGHDSYASHFTVGSGHIVWWDSYTRDGRPYTRIWKAPVTGGEPTLVSTVSGHYGTGGETGDRLVVDGDAVYFSGQETGGVRTVPLAGGEAKPVADSRGYHILTWPWIASPGMHQARKTQCVEERDERTCDADASGLRIFTELRNVETGEERTVKIPDPDLQNVSCAVTYCLGSTPDLAPVAFTRDGKREIPLPGGGGPLADGPMLDRFVALTDWDKGRSQTLYDLETGRSAELGVKDPPWGRDSVDARMLLWECDSGASWCLVDLAAIR